MKLTTVIIKVIKLFFYVVSEINFRIYLIIIKFYLYLYFLCINTLKTLIK